MKKIFISTFFCFLSVLAVLANDYKILYITTPDIVIGGKTHIVGDTFSNSESISWTSPRQAMKVLDMASKTQALVVAEKYTKSSSRDLASYIVASKQLTTRRGELINTLELGIALGDEHYLLDSLAVETRLPVDDKKFFFATFEYNGESINKKLSFEDNRLIFDRSLFTIDGNPIDPFDVTLTVWYMDGVAGTRTLITDKMVLLPLGIK